MASIGSQDQIISCWLRYKGSAQKEIIANGGEIFTMIPQPNQHWSCWQPKGRLIRGKVGIVEESASDVLENMKDNNIASGSRSFHELVGQVLTT